MLIGTRRALLGGGKKTTYSDKVLGYSPIAYWPLNETSGTTAVCQVNAAQNGTYARNVSTMGTGTGIGDGNTAPLLDGTNDYVDIYSTALRDAFDGELGSVGMWIRANSANMWTDGYWRNPFILGADANNYIQVYKAPNGGDNNVGFEIKRGGTWNGTAQTTTTAAWFFLGMTWDKSGNSIKYYWNTQLATGACGDTWAGNLASTTCVIGSSSTNGNEWHGQVAHFAVFDAALNQASMEDLGTV